MSEDDFSVDESTHRISYKCIDIGITSDNIFDYRTQFGWDFDIESYAITMYNNNIIVIRDEKLKILLDECNK